jgi:hypothetical protein
MNTRYKLSNYHLLEEPETSLAKLQKISKEIVTYQSLMSSFGYRIEELRALREMITLENSHELEIIKEFI